MKLVKTMNLTPSTVFTLPAWTFRFAFKEFVSKPKSYGRKNNQDWNDSRNSVVGIKGKGNKQYENDEKQWEDVRLFSTGSVIVKLE